VAFVPFGEDGAVGRYEVSQQRLRIVRRRRGRPPARFMSRTKVKGRI